MLQKKRTVIFIMNMLLVSLIGNLFLIQGSQASGTTWYVDDSNTIGPWDGTQTYPYQTIHDAVTVATNGDTIFVYNGTYNEKVDITKNITIQGENTDTVFVDAGGAGHVINAHGTFGDELHVTLEHLTIRNAGGSGFDCVTFSYVTNGEISENKILNSQEGEGISIDHCQGVIIRLNTIMNNKVTGISLTASEQNTIDQNIIQNNQKGISLSSSSNNNEITSNTIRENTVYGVYIVRLGGNSTGNILSKNDFTQNSQNAQDQCTNYWSKNSQGNYWDDYDNYDNNSDGIGDTPYVVPGGSNLDEFPLGYFIVPEEPSGDGNQRPVVAFVSISPNTAVVNETITFSGEGTDVDGYIVAYQWRSNRDGTLSDDQSFTTSTLSIGTHTIYLKVMDNEGYWSSEKTGMVTINAATTQAPTAFIDEITPDPAIQGEPVFFQGHGTDEDGVITAYKWISNKSGIIGTASSFTKSNLSVGTHTIYFQVKDEVDWSSPVQMTITIQRNLSGNPDNHAPHAYPGGPYVCKVNQAVSFNGSLSFDDEGSIAGFWNFGDNTTGAGLITTHIYSTPGTYTVTLTVTDEEGMSSTAATTAIITQSDSQSNSLGGFFIADFEIPFPVLIVAVVLLIVGILIGFIYKIQQRY